MADLTGLIARLEKLDEPNYELEVQIEAALFDNCGVSPSGRYVVYRDKYTARRYSPPNYTASIDEAVALVEKMLPGWNWWSGGIGRAAVDRKDPHSRFEAIHPFPAIAICLALLKALQAKEQTDAG